MPLLPSYISRYLIAWHYYPFISTGTQFHVSITLPSQKVPLGLQGISCWVHDSCKFAYLASFKLCDHLYRPFGALYWLYPEDETLNWCETRFPHSRLHGVLIRKTAGLVPNGSHIYGQVYSQFLHKAARFHGVWRHNASVMSPRLDTASEPALSASEPWLRGACQRHLGHSGACPQEVTDCTLQAWLTIAAFISDAPLS
jgi:hypothetical protein